MTEQDSSNLPDVEKNRRGRSLAIALSLAAFVILVYAITIIRLGPGVLERPL